MFTNLVYVGQKMENVKKQNCYFNGDIIISGKETKSIKIELSQHQLFIKIGYGPLSLLSSCLFKTQIRPRLRLSPDCLSPSISFIHGTASSKISTTYQLMFKSVEERNEFYETFLSFLYVNIGCFLILKRKTGKLNYI